MIPRHLCCLLLLTLPALGAEPVSLLGGKGVGHLRLSIKAEDGKPTEVGGARLISVEGGGQAWRGEPTRYSTKGWNVRLEYNSTAPVKKGDRLLLSFTARSVKTLPAQPTGWLTFGVKLPGSMMGNVGGGLGPEMAWQTYNFPFVANEDVETGRIYGHFDLGGGEQIVEIKDVELANYGPDYPIEKLPRTVFSYAGREADAPWRAAAAERIERNRLHDFTLQITDAAGKPVPAGVNVVGALQRPKFLFGTALAAYNGPTYLEHVSRLFNAVTPENSVKHPQFFEPGRGHVRALFDIDWARGQRLKVHGHLLFWPMWKYMRYTPDEIEAYKKDVPALRARILEQAREKLVTLKGKVDTWEVVNEIQWQREVLDVLNAGGVSDADIIADLIRLARSIDPGVPLVINESGIIENHPTTSPIKIAFYDKLFADLAERGVKVDAFAFQGHFHTLPPSPESVLKIWDHFAAKGLKLYVSEFDVKTTDEALQADWTRDFYTLAYSHPAVAGVTMWGFWEGAHWIPQGAMYRRDWSPKPNALAYDAVRRDWTTQFRLKTDAQGRITFRGHSGAYALQLWGSDHRVTLTEASVDAASPRATVALNPAK